MSLLWIFPLYLLYSFTSKPHAAFILDCKCMAVIVLALVTLVLCPPAGLVLIGGLGISALLR